MAGKKKISFGEITRRLAAVRLPAVDCVVGIAESGAVAASLAAAKLGCELQMIHIRFRGEDNRPMFPRPRLRGRRLRLGIREKRILLVDDVSVSGKTLDLAKKMLGSRRVKTFVLKGKADYVLFPEIRECIAWPWKAR